MANFGQDKQVQASYFTLEVDGVALGFFTSCSGLNSELEVVSQKARTDNGPSIETKQPGRQSFSEVVLKMMASMMGHRIRPTMITTIGRTNGIATCQSRPSRAFKWRETWGDAAGAASTEVWV